MSPPGTGRLSAWRVDLAELARDPECASDLRPERSRVARPRGHPDVPSSSPWRPRKTSP
jgi:hypothetical protein